jgi:hypothetical protein
MRFYFDVIFGLNRVADTEGSAFSSRAEAFVEAHKIVLELSIEELRKGCRLGADWRVEISDEAHATLGSVLFYDVLFEPPADQYSARILRQHLLGEVRPWPAYQRSQEALAESREIVASVRSVFREMKQRLDGLA